MVYMSESTSDNARHEILEVKHLPPLSITATRLLEAVGDPDIEVEHLADIINHDPGLMGRIVGLANAAYFGQRNPITTVQEAIIRVLGINMVKSLALSISVSGAFQVNNCLEFDTKEYWFNAVGCATLSRMMALRVPIDDRPDPDRIYLSGLLHNIGNLVLAHLFPTKLVDVFTAKEKDQELGMVTLQQEILGVDWISAGEWLAERWHLPDFIGRTIRLVADPGSVEDEDYEIHLVRSSIQWLNGMSDPAADESRLKQDDALLRIPGLSSDALDVIEDKFISQCDELRSLAACL
jgi:HD-like signal output (HDOD) protein